MTIVITFHQESLKDKEKEKDSKPKFFLNNAGEVIKRTGVFRFHISFRCFGNFLELMT